MIKQDSSKHDPNTIGTTCTHDRLHVLYLNDYPGGLGDLQFREIYRIAANHAWAYTEVASTQEVTREDVFNVQQILRYPGNRVGEVVLTDYELLVLRKVVHFTWGRFERNGYLDGNPDENDFVLVAKVLEKFGLPVCWLGTPDVPFV